MAFYQGRPVLVRLSYLAATAILVIFIVSVGANVANVNAGQPHPLTGPPLPGGCVEGQASVQEWCPGQEYKEGGWKRAKVCHNGQLVQETHDCTTETQTQTARCNAGDPPREVKNCLGDATHWESRQECVNGAWKTVQNPQPCPSCTEGLTKDEKYCPSDPKICFWRLACRNGAWKVERPNEHCPNECKDGGGEGEGWTCSDKGGCIGGGPEYCLSGFRCKNGIWEAFHNDNCEQPWLFGPGGVCVIATAAYGSAEAPEVQYMRYVRDNLIGSTHIGRILVEDFNAFYYLWSPSVARVITENEFLRAVFRVLLVPLIGIVHLAGLTFTSMTMMTGNAELASVVSFFIAALASVVAYVGLPVFFVMKMERSLRIRMRIRGDRLSA